jgi:hypothetical protein
MPASEEERTSAGRRYSIPADNPECVNMGRPVGAPRMLVTLSYAVGQDVWRHLGTDVLKCLHLEVCRSQSRLCRASGCSMVWRQRRIAVGFRSCLACTFSKTLRAPNATSVVLCLRRKRDRPKASRRKKWPAFLLRSSSAVVLNANLFAIGTPTTSHPYELCCERSSASGENSGNGRTKF